MKKVMVLLVMVAVALVSTVAVAGDLNCRLDGDDVIVPDRVIQAITDFDPNKPVYAACDVNGWLVSGKASKFVLEWTEMVQEQDGNWRARDMKSERFNPAQLKKEGKFFFKNINWAQLHHFLPASWLKMKGGIAIYLKK